MAHSKRNTSRAVFTSYEREQAKKAWGQNSARLSRESFLPFASCRLCLERAIDPVSCTHGDIFCRECALSNILAQKKEIKRVEKLRQREAREEEESREKQDEEAQERAIREFELTQNGLDVKAGSAAAAAESRNRPGNNDTENSSQQRSGKRKFELDEDELLRIATEDREKARKAIDYENASKPKLPSFWTPSITPSSNTKDTLHEVEKKTKTAPTCPASTEDRQHTYSLRTLITVHFTEEEDAKTKTQQRVCPSCRKVLSNSSKAMLAKPCGHVVCNSCVDKFMRPSGHHDPHAEEVDSDSLRCYACDADLVDNKSKDKTDKGKKKDKENIKPGIVEIQSEGTGFSAGGANQVKKVGVAFQC